jgi:hypothetical protein
VSFAQASVHRNASCCTSSPRRDVPRFSRRQSTRMAFPLSRSRREFARRVPRVKWERNKNSHPTTKSVEILARRLLLFRITRFCRQWVREVPPTGTACPETEARTVARLRRTSRRRPRDESVITMRAQTNRVASCLERMFLQIVLRDRPIQLASRLSPSSDGTFVVLQFLQLSTPGEHHRAAQR